MFNFYRFDQMEDGKIICNPKKNIVVDARREWTYEEILKMMKDEWGGLMK